MRVKNQVFDGIETFCVLHDFQMTEFALAAMEYAAQHKDFLLWMRLRLIAQHEEHIERRRQYRHNHLL